MHDGDGFSVRGLTRLADGAKGVIVLAETVTAKKSTEAASQTGTFRDVGRSLCRWLIIKQVGGSRFLLLQANG